MKTAIPTILLATLVSSAVAAPFTDSAHDVAIDNGVAGDEMQALFNAEEDESDFDELDRRGFFDDIKKIGPNQEVEKLKNQGKNLLNAASIADEIFAGIKKVFDEFKQKHAKQSTPTVPPTTPDQIIARGFLDELKNAKGAFEDIKTGVANDDLIGGLKKALEDFQKNHAKPTTPPAQQPAEVEAPPADAEPEPETPAEA